MIEETAEQIVTAIRDEIAAYEKLKAKLQSARGDEAKRIERQKYDMAHSVTKVLKKALVDDRKRPDLWQEFVEWEKSLS